MRSKLKQEKRGLRGCGEGGCQAACWLLALPVLVSLPFSIVLAPSPTFCSCCFVHFSPFSSVSPLLPPSVFSLHPRFLFIVVFSRSVAFPAHHNPVSQPRRLFFSVHTSLSLIFALFHLPPVLRPPLRHFHRHL